MTERGKQHDSIPPLGASRWQWAAWWVQTLVTYAAYISAASVAAHFVVKYW